MITIVRHIVVPQCAMLSLSKHPVSNIHPATLGISSASRSARSESRLGTQSFRKTGAIPEAVAPCLSRREFYGSVRVSWRHGALNPRGQTRGAAPPATAPVQQRRKPVSRRPTALESPQPPTQPRPKARQSPVHSARKPLSRRTTAPECPSAIGQAAP